MKIVVGCDGSEPSLNALRHAMALARSQPGAELHLLNVQAPVSGTAQSFVGAGNVRQYHQEEGAKEAASARQLLDEAGIKYECHVAVGQPGATIAAYADERGCDQIVIGTSGTGGWKKLLGTTATDVLEHAKVPVTFVK